MKHKVQHKQYKKTIILLLLQWTVAPALKFNIVPVIAVQCSRKSTACATSSGLTQRLSAVFFAAKAINTGISVPILLDLVCRLLSSPGVITSPGAMQLILIVWPHSQAKDDLK